MQPLVLTEDQTLLAKTAREVVAKTSPLARIRRIRDEKNTLAYSTELWRELVDLGWTAMPFSEEDGGLGLGLADVVVVTEALGALLAPEPFVPSIVHAGMLVARTGSAAQKTALLAPTISGELRLAVAHEEPGSRGNLTLTRTRATKDAGGYRISGKKTPVLGGTGAGTFLVVARTSGEDGDRAGLTLFAVPQDASGLRATPLLRVDSRNAAAIELERVLVSASAVVGEIDDAFPELEAAVDRATIALAGEMLGGMAEAFRRTVSYLREREQFGRKIGSFQALQHRAARLFVEVELTRTAVMAAARAIDAGAPDAPALVSVAKARASDAFVLVANEAVQMHGGIGMTDEHDIGFFLKRAKAAELTYGDAVFHRARFARLRGF